MPPTTHSNLGASKAERWMNCPGSVALEAGLPDVKTEYSKQGTAAHDLAERALRKGLDPEVWLDSEIEGVMVDEEMVEAVRVFVHHVRTVAAHADTAPLLETKFDLSSLNPPGPMFGTADAVVYNEQERHLHVIDYKHGAGVAVDATENAQLLYYALGAVVALQVMPVQVTVTIVQPRAHHHAGIVRDYTLPFAELVEFKRELFHAAALTQEPDAPLAVGEWCRFCKAQATCPKQRENAVAVAQREFDVMESAPVPLPERLSPDDLSFVLERAHIVEDWLRAVRQHVTNLINTGTPVPGWKLVPKRATRKWRDEREAAAYLEELIGGDAYVQKVVSPAQAEKQLKKVATTLADELVVKESSGVNLVPDTDPRPATVSAQVEFAALPASTTRSSEEA